MAANRKRHISALQHRVSEAHNAEGLPVPYASIGGQVYVVSTFRNNERWVNLTSALPGADWPRQHRRMVRKRPDAMQEKNVNAKGKNGKIIKVAGCSPISEVLLVEPDTTVADDINLARCKQR